MEEKFDFSKMKPEWMKFEFPEIPSGIQPGHIYGAIDSNGKIIPDLDLNKCRFVLSNEIHSSKLNWNWLKSICTKI